MLRVLSCFHVGFTRDLFGFWVEVLWGYLGFLSVSNIDLTVGHIVVKRYLVLIFIEVDEFIPF